MKREDMNPAHSTIRRDHHEQSFRESADRVGVEQSVGLFRPFPPTHVDGNKLALEWGVAQLLNGRLLFVRQKEIARFNPLAVGKGQFEGLVSREEYFGFYDDREARQRETPGHQYPCEEPSTPVSKQTQPRFVLRPVETPSGHPDFDSPA